MDDIKAGVQYIFQTNNPMTLALSATGHAAMECVMTNMLEPGRTVMICNSGIWGIRSADMASSITFPMSYRERIEINSRAPPTW